MEFEQGDILLVKLVGGKSARPARPDGTVYDDTKIELFGGSNPVYHYFSNGEVVPVKMVHGGGVLKGKWHKYPSHQYEKIHKKWIKILKYREGEIDFEVQLDDVPDDFDPSETEPTTEEQEEKGSSVTSERDAWSESKSDTMSNLKNL